MRIDLRKQPQSLELQLPYQNIFGTYSAFTLRVRQSLAGDRHCCFVDRATRSTGQDRDRANAQNKASDLQLCRAAYRNRTDDLRIRRGAIPGRAPASCSDRTDHRIDGTRGAGIIRRPGPRRGSCAPFLLLCVTSLKVLYLRPGAGRHGPTVLQTSGGTALTCANKRVKQSTGTHWA
jgi:hypothetical protein